MIIVADWSTSSYGDFGCTSQSSMSLLSSSSVDITSSTIDLSCYVNGPGDLSLSCNKCGMVIGGDYNNYLTSIPYHCSNTLLSKINTTGNVLFGSKSERNISHIWIEAAAISTPAASLTLSASQGSIEFKNISSEIVLTSANASLFVKAKSNTSINSNLTIATPMGGTGLFLFEVDNDCSVVDFNRVSVGASAHLLLDTSTHEMVISAPSVTFDGVINASLAPFFKIEGTCLQDVLK